MGRIAVNRLERIRGLGELADYLQVARSASQHSRSALRATRSSSTMNTFTMRLDRALAGHARGAPA